MELTVGLSSEAPSTAFLLVYRHQLICEAGPRNCAGASPCYAFRHVLYKQAVYGRIPPARKKRLHLSLGQSGTGLDVRSDEAETEMAYQFEQGGDYVRAIEYLVIASQTAALRCELHQSVAILEHASNLAKKIPGPDRGRIEMQVWQELATVQSALKNPGALGFDGLLVQPERTGDSQNPEYLA